MHGKDTARQTTGAHRPQRAHGTHTVYHDFDGSAKLTTTVVHALADATGMDITDADFTLNDYVDPDALNLLFSSRSDGTPRANGHVSFTVMGFQTTINANGQITIVPLDSQPVR